MKLTLPTLQPAPDPSSDSAHPDGKGGQRHSGHAVRLAPYRATRRRLVAINVLVVSSILAVMALAVYGWELHASDQQVNEQLVHWASHESLGDLPIGAGGSLLPEAGDGHDAAERYEPTSPNVFSLVINAQGRVVFDPGNLASLGLPDLAVARSVLAGSQESTLATVAIRGHTYRLYTVPVRQHGQVIGALQTGMSLAARDRQLHDLLLTLAGVGIGVLLLTALASVYLADRALVPLRLAFERQRQFAAAASHELRTPLAIVRSQAELVERYLRRAASHSTIGADAERTREDVEEILAEVDYMGRLVRDLLLLARDEGDQRGLIWDTLDPRAIAEDAVAKVRPQAKAHGLTLALVDVLDGLTVRMRGDADRLRQLMLILLENAIQYTVAGGSITVTVRLAHERRLLVTHTDTVQLVVADTGRGIAPADIERIFEPFYRSAPERSSAPGDSNASGAGLGLALARWIVTAHGGEITVGSEPGAGTTFTVTLPVSSEEGDAP